VFLPIEGRTAVFDQQAALLFAFRATALERHMKEAELAAVPDQRKLNKVFRSRSRPSCSRAYTRGRWA